MKLKLSEKELQNLIEGYLWKIGFYVIRLNSGKFKAVDKYGKERFIRGQEPGTPDLMAFKEIYPDGAPNKAEVDLLFLEIKVPGNKPTFLQEQKMKQLEEYGARCFIVHSLEEAQQVV